MDIISLQCLRNFCRPDYIMQEKDPCCTCCLNLLLNHPRRTKDVEKGAKGWKDKVVPWAAPTLVAPKAVSRRFVKRFLIHKWKDSPFFRFPEFYHFDYPCEENARKVCADEINPRLLWNSTQWWERSAGNLNWSFNPREEFRNIARTWFQVQACRQRINIMSEGL